MSALIVESLLISVDCFYLGIPEFLTTFDAVSLLQASVIFSKMRKRRTRVTPFRHLAAVDTSGGVARQQKIMHAHESPFYHYAVPPTLSPLLTVGKKYSRILFGQTMYISN
jgi:hypothetical protein